MTGARCPERPGWPPILWLLLTLALILRINFSAGLSGNDDLAIGFNAIRLLDQGLWLPQGHYEARYGLIIPLAAIFYMFGVGVIQLIAMPMAVSLFGIFLAWRIGAGLFGRAAGLWAAAALAVYPMDVEFAGVFFPDATQGTLMAAAFWLSVAGQHGRQRMLTALAAGFLWAWAYYVKVDSFVMAAVFTLAWLLGYLTFARMLFVGLVALSLVGVELAVYARLAGDPLHHIALDRIATNEALAAGQDYRNFMTYPKAMFLTVYQTGLQYYLGLGAVLLALIRRERAALLVVGWVMIFHAWLAFGIDPLASPVRLKPQLTRYLMVYAIPLSVLVGWFIAWSYDKISRALTVLAALSAAALALLCMTFNTLNYQAARASTLAVQEAVRNNWFPLYTEVQSIQVARFLLHGSPHAAQVMPAQEHDFLRGETRFRDVSEPRAWLLINEEYSRRLERRNLVKPIAPERFGMLVVPVLSIDRPLPGISYVALDVLARAADLLPIASLRTKIRDTAQEAMAPGVAKVYELSR